MERPTEEFEGVYCIWCYHVYKDIWETSVGEIDVWEREPQNPKDRYTVAVVVFEISYQIIFVAILENKLPSKHLSNYT